MARATSARAMVLPRVCSKITARAIEVEPHRFRLDVETVVLTKVDTGGQELEISTWRGPGDLKVVRRS
jgi:hypothetical protein